MVHHVEPIPFGDLTIKTSVIWISAAITWGYKTSINQQYIGIYGNLLEYPYINWYLTPSCKYFYTWVLGRSSQPYSTIPD